MAEGTYEYECMRAELLGIDRPNEIEFEKARAERLKQEEAELEAAEATLLEEQSEALKSTGGKLDELNSILSSTQQKLTRFKQTACGSLSNIFSKGSVDGGCTASDVPSTSATASRRNTTASGGSCGPRPDDTNDDDDLNKALDCLDEMQQQQQKDGDIQPIIPIEKIRSAKLDIQKKMGSHLDKLDALIHKADHAEVAMAEQTKDMKRMAK